MDKKIYEKITAKKEFSQLPKKDVQLAIEKFEKKDLNEYQLVKLTRNFLRKIYSSFTSRKLLGDVGKKDAEWILNKHKSTKERLPFYGEIYGKSFFGVKGKEFSVIDLGAGINGLTYKFMEKSSGKKINYVGVEAIGQLVELMNNFFKSKGIKNATAIHESLFELEKIKKLIKKQKGKKIILMFKVIDSLEDIERDYSKKLIKEIMPLSNRIVLSFATKSLGRRSKFSAQRNWIVKFINENFKVIEDFELGGERYLVFEKR